MRELWPQLCLVLADAELDDGERGDPDRRREPPSQEGWSLLLRGMAASEVLRKVVQVRRAWGGGAVLWDVRRGAGYEAAGDLGMLRGPRLGGAGW